MVQKAKLWRRLNPATGNVTRDVPSRRASEAARKGLNRWLLSGDPIRTLDPVLHKPVRRPVSLCFRASVGSKGFMSNRGAFHEHDHDELLLRFGWDNNPKW
jgi:hypothetical protein